MLRGRFVATWLAGTTLGVVVRMVALGHYRWNELAFWLVALVFLGLFAAVLRSAGTRYQRYLVPIRRR